MIAIKIILSSILLLIIFNLVKKLVVKITTKKYVSKKDLISEKMIKFYQSDGSRKLIVKPSSPQYVKG